MMVLRNGQQVEFVLSEDGDLVQTSTFRAQAGFVLEVQNFLLPMGEDRVIVVASNLGLARQIVTRYMAIREEEAAAAAAAEAARRAEEDAAWAARGRMAAREQVAQQIAEMDDTVLDLLRESLHKDRRNLVNLYIGEDRKERIAETDLIIGVIEEEQAERAGLASSEDILAAFAAL